MVRFDLFQRRGCRAACRNNPLMRLSHRQQTSDIQHFKTPMFTSDHRHHCPWSPICFAGEASNPLASLFVPHRLLTRFTDMRGLRLGIADPFKYPSGFLFSFFSNRLKRGHHRKEMRVIDGFHLL